MSIINSSFESISPVPAQALYVDVYGVKAILRTDCAEFIQFVERNYEIFTRNSFEQAHITVVYSKEAGAYAKSRRDHLCYFGQSIWMGNGFAYWENEFGFRLLIDITDDQHWQIYSYHEGLLISKNDDERHRDYQRSIRWAFHFPIFILLKKLKGMSLLHASAVSKDGEALVFCGLNKVGKSSLSLEFVNNHKYDFLSDNFLLYNKDQIYAFPEQIRMSPEAINRLEVLLEASKHSIYGKHHIRVPPERTCRSAFPKSVFLLSVGNGLKITTVESLNFHEVLLGLHNYLKEFPEYSFYGLLPHLGVSLANERQFALPQKTRFYHLTHPMNWSLSETVKEILKNVY